MNDTIHNSRGKTKKKTEKKVFNSIKPIGIDYRPIKSCKIDC